MHTKFSIKIIFFSLLFILLSTSCSLNNNRKEDFNPNIKVDYPYYNNLTEALVASTDVIRGNIIEDRGIKEYILEDDLGPEYTTKLPYRIYVLEVTESLKGSLSKDDHITVKVDNIEEPKELTNDGLYFLEVFEDKNEPANIINPMQGNIPIEENTLQLNTDTKIFFENNMITEKNSNASKSNPTIPVEDAFTEINSILKVPETSTSIDYPYYSELTEIFTASTDVIRGKIIEDQGIKDYILKDDLGPEYDTKLPYRIYVLEVTENLKGSLSKGDHITVKIDNIEEKRELTEDGLYFLEVYEDKNDPANTVNPMQGNIPIEGDSLKLNKDTKLFFPKEEMNLKEAIQEIQNLE